MSFEDLFREATMAICNGLTTNNEEPQSDLVRRNNQADRRSIREGGSWDSGDHTDQDANPGHKKQRPQRHTPEQIEQLEALFRITPHPDENQRIILSRHIGMEIRQIKFWFQNRRTNAKNQTERQENTMLREENNKLRAEKMAMIQGTMQNPVCNRCGSPATLVDIPPSEEHHLKIENERLKDELRRVYDNVEKILGRPVSSLAGPVAGLGPLRNTAPANMTDQSIPPVAASTVNSWSENSFKQLALAAMDELLKMALEEEPLWVQSSQGGKAALNYEEYLRSFPRCIGPKPVGYVSEASRESGIVMINTSALIEILMKDNTWAAMFPFIVSSICSNDILSSGAGGSLDGALKLMQADFLVVSPYVPVREANFIRFCRQPSENVWVVVDVSINGLCENRPLRTGHVSCRRLPSGCVVQDLKNGLSKVIWVEHTEYDEAVVHHLYRPLLRSGLGMGAERWLASLMRQCECLAMLTSIPVLDQQVGIITTEQRPSILNLALKMTDRFCMAVSGEHRNWTVLQPVGDIRLMARQIPSGDIVINVATSVWLPVSLVRLFDFLREEGRKIIYGGESMMEIAHIAKQPQHGNVVSLLRPLNENQSNMLMLQEICMDQTGSIIAYSPVHISTINVILKDKTTENVELFPSGFAITPDGRTCGSRVITVQDVDSSSVATDLHPSAGGSLLTMAFQILTSNEQQFASGTFLCGLVSSTIQKINAALNCDG